MNEILVEFIQPEIEIEIEDSISDIDIGNPVKEESLERFNGDYEITPSQQPIVLNTKNKKMTQNLVINPIPHNYGKITWHGSGSAILIT